MDQSENFGFIKIFAPNETLETETTLIGVEYKTEQEIAEEAAEEAEIEKMGIEEFIDTFMNKKTNTP